MKEKNAMETTQKRKKLIYSLVVAICVLLLAAATVLTVYFVTTGKKDVLENPNPNDGQQVQNPSQNEPSQNDPAQNNPSQNDPSQDDPSQNDPSQNNPSDDPNKPVGGETERFVSPVESGVCSVEYESIYTNATLKGQIRKHMGVDFTAAEGTSVNVVADGIVREISLDEVLGNVITIDHGDGLYSVYRFVEPDANLKEGEIVTKGASIGKVAKAYGTEQFSGEHLHFEMTVNGDWVDPAAYFDLTYEEK